MSTYGSIAFVDQTQGYVVEVNGPDMMYSGRGKDICGVLTRVESHELQDLRNRDKILQGIVMYVNYLRAKRHERSLKEMFSKDFIEALGFSGLFWEFKTEPIKAVPLTQVGIVNGDGSEWTYIKNITNKSVPIYVYKLGNYKKPFALYELLPEKVCCLQWGCIPKGNIKFNKDLKFVKEL